MLRRIEVRIGQSRWVGPNMLIPWTGMESLSKCKRQRRMKGAEFWFTELGWQKFGREVLSRSLEFLAKEREERERFGLPPIPLLVRVRVRRETGSRKVSELRGDKHQVAIRKGR